MPVTPTYPGVYVEEVPSGVRTIVGVATSITAFVGRAARGPVNRPMTVNGFGDFERTFGGLWNGSRLGFTVRDFFVNGGAQAIVVRVQKKATVAEIDLPANTLPRSPRQEGEPKPSKKGGDKEIPITLVAANPGAWGARLRVTVDYEVKEEAALRYGLQAQFLFNLTIEELSEDEKTVLFAEKFRNLTTVDSPRRFDTILEQRSQLVSPQTNTNKDYQFPMKGEKYRPKPNTGDDGVPLDEQAVTGSEDKDKKEGLYALEDADLFNLLCIPPYTSADDVDDGVLTAAAKYCEKRRAMLLVDPKSCWTSKNDAKNGIESYPPEKSANTALFFPRLLETNPLKDNQVEAFAPSGAMAGIFARTDVRRGVWKAPAGLEATVSGIRDLTVPLTDAENGELNPLGINCIRVRPAAGPVVWGARTLKGDDRLASEWKYIPVRRTALYIEESLYRGTQWVVFEPNDEPLWAQIRLNIGSFMHNLFRQGAFQGMTPRDSYFVKCDKETTTQADIDLGIVKIAVGFAPLKPAEFVIIQIQQMAGQIET